MTPDTDNNALKPDCDICGRPYSRHNMGSGFPMCPVAAIGYRPKRPEQNTDTNAVDAQTAQVTDAMVDSLAEACAERVVQWFSECDAGKESCIDLAPMIRAALEAALLTTSPRQTEGLVEALTAARDEMCKAWCGDGHCGPCCDATDALLNPGGKP